MGRNPPPYVVVLADSYVNAERKKMTDLQAKAMESLSPAEREVVQLHGYFRGKYVYVKIEDHGMIRGKAFYWRNHPEGEAEFRWEYRRWFFYRVVSSLGEALHKARY